MKLSHVFLVLSCTIVFTRHVKGARILGLFPSQGKSHFIMFQEVMKSLADAGHQVDVVSHFPQKKPYPNYTDTISLAGTIPMNVNNLPYEMIEPLAGGSVKAIVQLAGTNVCNLLEVPDIQNLIKNPPTDPPYDLLITEAWVDIECLALDSRKNFRSIEKEPCAGLFYTSCYFAFGRHLKVPVVVISSRTIPPYANEPLGNPLNTAIVSEIDDRPATHMNFWQRLKNTVDTIRLNLKVRYHMRVQNDMVKKHFGPEIPNIEQLEREVSLVLVNSHFIFHGVRPMTPAVVEVAGLHVRDDNTPISPDLQEWLDDSKNGFIYFSLGSMAKVESFPKAALAEIYSAFAKVTSIRILMKVAKPDELPPGLPDNVKTLTWAPQVQVLKHKNIRAFLTHGGLMGLQEAVTFAVPLIGMPLFSDQMGNMNICVEKEIAVALNYKNLKSDEIVAAINAVVHNPKYKKNMNAISKQFLDRPRDARSLAVYWIEYILRHGEDALRSPAVKLTWWELSLLDVYGSVIAAVVIMLCVLKLLMSTIICRVLYTDKTLLLFKKRI